MERKLKKQKGITLVALIITIIVLLILAMVAISVVRGNGILNHAQNAKSAYVSSQDNESTTLNSYMNYIDNKIKTLGNNEEDNIIRFTITFQGEEEHSFECPVSYKSWEEWAESEYNNIGDAPTVLGSITLEPNGKDLIDPTTKPINGHKYGYDGPVSW